MQRKSFVKQFVSLGIGSFVYLLVGLIGTPIITRLVDPVVYGDFSIFSVYSSIGFSVLVLGLDQSFVRFFYSHDSAQYRSRLLYACLMPSIIATLIVGVGILVISSSVIFFENGKITVFELIFIILNVLVTLINRYSTLSARLQYDTTIYSMIGIVQKSLFLLISITLVKVINNSSYILLILATIISTFIANMIGIVKERNIWLPQKDNSSCLEVPRSELFKYGIPLLFSVSVTLLFNTLDKLALDRFCTRADVGIYASAMNLLAVFNVIRSSFNALWIPSAVEQYEKNKEDKTFFQRGNAFITILMLLYGAGMIMCKDLFVLLLGEEYRYAAVIFPFLMFEPIMYTISETTVTGLVVSKKSGYQVIVAVIACLTNFVGNWLLTPVMGPKGAALSTGISYIVFFVLRTVFSNKVYYVDYHLPKFALMTVLLLLYATYGSSHTFSVYQIVFFGVYSCILFLVYREEVKEAAVYGKSLLKKFFRKGQ